jgi:hypothetical protein
MAISCFEGENIEIFWWKVLPLDTENIKLSVKKVIIQLSSSDYMRS